MPCTHHCIDASVFEFGSVAGTLVFHKDSGLVCLYVTLHKYDCTKQVNLTMDAGWLSMNETYPEICLREWRQYIIKTICFIRHNKIYYSGGDYHTSKTVLKHIFHR